MPLPVHTLSELVAYAKANPGKLSYGSAGVGSTAHLCAELFKKLAGLPNIVHVPYKGANPGLVDFYSGQLPMFAASISPQVFRTPHPIIDQIVGASRQAMADSAFQKRLIEAGFEPVMDSGPEQTAQFIKEKLVRWTPLLKASGIRVN
jgi:tripartite-type tricarboxylate transporter receptor subunit TctC